MKIADFIFLDCQTTGMRPSSGRLIELAWAHGEEEIESHLVQIDEPLPRRISEITGISAEELRSKAKSPAAVFAALTARPANLAVIHYAQFELPFLHELHQSLAGTPFALEVFCSHQLTKRLFPNLPSQNIRSAAGFFGFTTGALKRATSHVEATRWIWSALLKELHSRGVESVEQLRQWLQDAPKVKRERYEYRLDRVKRLALPNKPGVYRMLSRSGEILYVGKATSLKSRVNSYFRGQKSKTKRELLAQIWDLKISECETPLEAALLESDEIKKHNPPYNVVLKSGRRSLVFYKRDYSESSLVQDENFPLGPFRGMNWIEHLKAIVQGNLAQAFFDPVPPDLLEQGFALFTQAYPRSALSIRSLLATGMWKLRQQQEEATTEDEAESTAEPPQPTAEDIAAKFGRLVQRAANEVRRAKAMTRLLNSDVSVKAENSERRLRFRSGRLDHSAPSPAWPWRDLNVADFDRMSILLSEVNKGAYRVQYLE